ncbi:MAG: hypothetical protein SGI73_06665 [Chloroflexota bacterium]|nr:hypothetical protein [Chloroflexota bacterium]
MSRPDGRYKLTDAEKTTVKAELRAALIAAAQARELLTYTELVLRIPSVVLHPHSFILAHLMREVCGDEYDKTGVMLCALVVSKLTGVPGAGYFRGFGAASAASNEDNDWKIAWREDVERAFSYWSKS